MLTRTHYSILIGIAALHWGLMLQWKGVATPSWELLAPYGSVVGTLVCVDFAFNKWIWRWSWVHGILVRRPDLRGTWKVTLKSDWKDPETGESKDIDGVMSITQSFSSLQMHLMTKESQSVLLAHSILPSPTGSGYTIAAVYTNTPELPLQESKSRVHQGAFTLQTHGPEHCPASMSGIYWTARGTKGSLELSARKAETATRFEEGRRLFEPPVDETA